MDEDLHTVERFQFLPEAEAARMHLEEAGLRAFLADAESVNAAWTLGNALGHIKLQVPTSEVDAALSLLRHPPARAEGDCLACGASWSDGRATECPACGWTFADGPPEEEEEAADQDAPLAASETMEQMRSWRRPILLLAFSPAILIVCLSALVVLFVVAFGLVNLVLPR